MFELKLSFLKTIDKYNIYVLHLSSFVIEDNERIQVDINNEDFDSSSYQVIGIYAIPRRKHKKTVLSITPPKETDINRIYKKLEKINGIKDIEFNDKLFFNKLKSEFYSQLKEGIQ